MCRVLSYLGNPILLDDLLYKPDNSFIKQSYHPIYLPHMLNLAGFGMVAWDETSFAPKLPFIYKTERLPFYDTNLASLTRKIAPNCLLAHIRGVPYTEKKVVSMQNVHPFLFPDTGIAFAHNGSLFDFPKIKYELLHYIHPKFKNHILGNTDSEWLYAVFLSQLAETQNKIFEAIMGTLAIIKNLRYELNIRVNSPINIFISNGSFIAATRFVFDFGWQPLNAEGFHNPHLSYHSLWYTYGEKYVKKDNEYIMQNADMRKSIIIASEPLTTDTTTWIEIPEYTMIMAEIVGKEIKITSHDIQL